jgi:flavin reductase
MLREDFLSGMRLAATGVSIVTTKGLQGWAGATVSAVCSVSADPPSLLVCLHHQSRIADAIIASGVFCVNLLSDEQMGFSEIFAGRAEPPGQDRFSVGSWLPLATGAPSLVGALVAFDCSLVREVRCGSHHVVIGAVCDVEQGDGRPLLYYDRTYGRVTLESLQPIG